MVFWRSWKTEASRRDVFPDLDQNTKSARSREELVESSQEGHLSKPEQFQDDLRTFPQMSLCRQRLEGEMATTSEKTAVRDGDDVTEERNSRRQLSLCELMTMQMLHSQLTPIMLKDCQTLEKGIYLENQTCATGRRWSSGDATGLSTS